MTNYVKRFIYLDASEKARINPLVWPFFFAITIYGLGFALFPDFYFVNSSSLFQSLAGVHDWLPQIWGAAAFISGASALAMVALRRTILGGTAAMFGFLVWLFAAILYAMNGYLLVFLTVSGPNLFFWVYYYIRLKWYLRMKKLGRLQDPE